MIAENRAREGNLTQNLAFSQTRLRELASRLKDDYQKATPFPHVVIDDLMPAEMLDRVLREFPAAKSIEWDAYDDATQKKLAQKNEVEIGDLTRFLLYQFNSAPFIEFLESLTAIHGLIPDPHFWGGGLHQLEHNGFLKLHTDFNYHPVLKIDRRINVLLYLNKDWEESYGGHLELWDRDISNCEAKILPIFNRCVIFNTTDYSYHGHPKPITCPPDRTRKSIALYYYTNGRPAGETKRTAWTNWQMTPEERRTGRFKRILSRLVPPIILDLKHAAAKAIKKQS